MEDLVGRKVKGFRFFHNTSSAGWNPGMSKHIGEVGVITYQYDGVVRVEFKNDWWYYPIEGIVQQLVDEK